MSSFPQSAGAAPTVVVGGPVTASVKLVTKRFDVPKIPDTLPAVFNGVVPQDEYINEIVAPLNDILGQNKLGIYDRILLACLVAAIVLTVVSLLLINFNSKVAGFGFIIAAVFVAVLIMVMLLSMMDEGKIMKAAMAKAQELSSALAPRGYDLRIDARPHGAHSDYFLVVSYDPTNMSNAAVNSASSPAPVVSPVSNTSISSESAPLLSGTNADDPDDSS